MGGQVAERAGQMLVALSVGGPRRLLAVVGGKPVVHDDAAVATQHADGDDAVDAPVAWSARWVQ